MNDLGCIFELTRLGTLAIDTMARDRQGAVKVIYLVAIQADSLLTTPAKTFSPRRMTEHHALRASLIFYRHLDSFIFTRGIENLYHCAMITLHYGSLLRN